MAGLGHRMGRRRSSGVCAPKCGFLANADLPSLGQTAAQAMALSRRSSRA